MASEQREHHVSPQCLAFSSNLEEGTGVFCLTALGADSREALAGNFDLMT